MEYTPIDHKMAITELALLPLKDASLPLTSPLLYPHFKTLAEQQRAHSGYKLHFFQSVTNPGLVILLSGWESVEAHNKWIAGEQNQALLKVFSPVLDIEGIMMVHLGIEPDKGWDGIEYLMYQRVGHGESYEAIQDGDIVWESVGQDVEGKTKDLFILKGYKSREVDNEDERIIVAKRVLFN